MVESPGVHDTSPELALLELDSATELDEVLFSLELDSAAELDEAAFPLELDSGSSMPHCPESQGVSSYKGAEESSQLAQKKAVAASKIFFK